jgi:thiamine biosynthesis lipoprotein
LAAEREACGFRQLRIDGNRVTKLHGGLMLDFSGIAKGHAVDLMGAMLRAAGCRDFVIEFGGEVLANGHAPGKNGWTVDGASLTDVRWLPVRRSRLLRPVVPRRMPSPPRGLS